MTIEEMKRRKTELGLTSEMISKKSGVPLGTVQKIFGGATKAPRKKTIDALERILKPGSHTVSEAGVYGLSDTNGPQDGNMLCEAPFQYGTSPQKKLYTLDDY